MKYVFLLPRKINGRIPERIFGCSYSMYPIQDLACLYAASVLREAGHNVKLVEFDSSARSINPPQADGYLVHSVYLTAAYDVALAGRLPGRQLFYFGPLPTLAPERYLARDGPVVLRGEIEHYLVKAVADPVASVGTTYRFKGRVHHNKSAGIIKNLDDLPLPARDLDDKREYYNPKLSYRRSTIVMASRGCANRCYFCVPNSISWARELEWKKSHRLKPPVTMRSAKSIIGEIAAVKRAGYKEFSFIDDQFVIGRQRAIDIMRGIKKYHLSFGMLARCDRLLDEVLVESMAQAGCRYVDLGVESFSQKILDDIRKDLKTSSIYRSIHLLKKYHIEPKLNIMLGTSPLENENTIRHTINETLELPVNYCMYSIATPYEGTEFAQLAKKNKWIKKKKAINPVNTSRISYSHLTDAKLEALNVMAYRQFYFRATVIWHFLRTLKSWRAVKNFCATALNLLKDIK